MKTKIKRHSRSILSVVLALCMLLSCMTAGMIMTDAAKVDSESVSWNPATDKFSYKVGSGEWTDLSFNSNGVTTFTVSNDNSTLEFKLVFNGTVYNHNSSQSTFSADGMHSKDGETRLAKIGGSDYSVSGVYADTYTVKLTTTVNNGEVNFKINGTYVEQASSWTVVGDSEELFGGTWNTTNTDNDLDLTKTPYEWTKNAVYLSAGDIEYKVVKNHAWAGCYPAAGNRKTTVSSSGYYNVTVTYDGNTDLKMTLDPAAKCTLTVPQIADATVTATYGSQTAAEGQSLTNVPAGADVSVTVIPDSGHKCTGVSGETLSAGSSTATGSGTNWTLKMPNSDATLSATIETYIAPMRTIYFYNKFTQYPMVSIYAYYKTGDTITDEIFGSGTTMTKMANSDLWYIDVPEDAYVRFMGEGYSTGELTQNSTKPKYIPGTNRKDPGNGGDWGEYIERNNVYSVNEGENMSSSNLFTGITATFFDYYVDNEVTGGWLTGITAESDYKCSGYTNDPYRTYLNAALSNYADNNITYPLYWGNNKNINGDNSDATANVNSGALYNFYLSVNNSAKLNPPSTAMQGLAGNTLAGGNIHHYKAGAADNNGAAMAFFDEDFLSGENSKNTALATILHSPKFPVRKDAASKTLYLDTSDNTGWEGDNAVMRAVFFNSAANEAGRHIVQAAKVADHLYAVAVPSDYAKVQWWRGDPNDVGNAWNYGNAVSIPTDNKIVCKIKGWDNNEEWVASSSTTTTHTYYEYDSTNGKDNAYITDINTTDKTANLSYYDQASGKHVQSQNNIKGFFPFDYNNVISAPYDVKKVYLNLNNIWNTENNAVFYAYFMGGSGFSKWVPMTLDNTVNYYSCEIPSGATGVIFVRQNSQGANFPSWDSKYNQTNDLSIPTDQKVIYKITGWGTDKSTGEWTSSNNVVVEKKVTSTNNFADPTGRLAHDQGFGMKLEIPFTLNKYGVNKDGSPQTFDFSGDDDLWVYIDDKLVLDLGGAHGRTTGTINFNSMQTVADTAAAVTTGTDQVDGGIRSYDFSSIINTAANDFNHNQIHTMTIYYMERGMFDSNLRFGFSFSAVDTLFSAEKKIRTRSLNSGFFVDNGLTGAESNMSDLKLDKGVRQVTEFEKSFQSDQFNITQTYVGPLPESHTDITYSIGADSTTISNATSPISYKLQNTDQTEKRAYFNGQFASGDTFTMKETANDGNKYNYTPSIIVYDEAKKLSNGNPTPFATVADATSRGQVSGNNTDGYKFLFQPINEPVAGGLEDLRIRARFENDMKQHALTIKKTVSDPADTKTEFIFEIQFDFTDDKVDNYVGYPLVINGHSDTTLSPKGRVTITAGQSITMYGIPENAKIKVVEITSPEGYVYDSTTVKTDGGLTVDTEDETQGVSFEMGTANTVVTFKNSKGEPVHITHTLHPDSTGQADCYVSATVQNASGVVQNDGTFEQTDAMITVPASFINYTSNNKLVIVLNTVPEDHSNFTNFYEKITDEMKPLAASGIPYSAEIDLPNRTATITIAIKDLFDQTTHKQLYKTLPFYSKLDLIADNFTISKKILDGMTSTETYNIIINTKANFEVGALATAYKGPYVIKHADGTTADTSVASDDTRTECKVELHPNDEIKIGVVTDTNFEITEEALSSDYQRKFHYVSSTVDGTTFDTDIPDTANVKKVTNGVLVKVTSDTKTVDINNKAWGYMIEYTYPGYLKRYGVNPNDNQKYYVSGLFSEDDYKDKVELAEVVDNSNGNVTGNVTVQGVRFKTAEIQKNFITSHAPYEDNFMTDLTWNPLFEGETGANTTRYFYANNTGEEVNMKTNAVVTENKECQVYFRFPFAYTSSNAGLVPTPSQNDGGKVLMTDAKQMNVQAPYGKWYTLNNKYTEAEAKFVSAPREIYKKNSDGTYDKYVFRYWSMQTTKSGKKGDNTHALRTTEEYKRCYYWDFNMTFYQDTIVEPFYELAGSVDTNLTPAELEARDTADGGGTNITFLENSRNQWNRNGGNNQEIDTRVKQGDRVYSDFLLSFSWDDIMLRTALSKKITETQTIDDEEVKVTYYTPYTVGDKELHYSGGLVIERVECPDITSTSQIKTQDQYRQQYGDGDDDGLVAAATNFINSGKANDGNFLLNETFSAAGFDNKNQFEYSTSFANKSHSDLTIDRPYKSYVYRAYTYLRDYDGSTATTGNCMVNGSAASADEVNKIKTHNGELLKVSKPVYFTIYEMATIENGTTYTGQGES